MGKGFSEVLLLNYGGSGFRGLELSELIVRVGEWASFGKGRNIEQLLAFRNSPNFSAASSDCRMEVSLHGLVRSLRLSLA